MRITYYRGEHPNFGDELNTWMWPKLVPDFFDDDERVLFIGIGSTIGDQYDKAAKKVVFGSAFVPQYNHMPDLTGEDWDIYFVRGPRTARLLNLSPDLSLGDSAILLRTLVDYRRRTPEVVSFMPHWESLERGNWEQICRHAGINLIDPRRPVEEVINELLRSRLVIAEAMHGAIVADAFRIPWIPVLPLDAAHREKWFDWAEALDIHLQRNRLWPSCITEAKHALRCRTRLVKIMEAVEATPLSVLANKVLKHVAAWRLQVLSKGTATLSDDKIMNSITEKMQEKLQELRRDYGK